MTERWISQKKHYCQICNTWLSGHIVNVKKHEQSTRHLENARQQLKDAYQRHQDRQKQEKMLERELQQMEAAAAAAMRNDEARLTSHASGGHPRGSGPSAYEQLHAQREEKARIQQFYEQRNANTSGAAQSAASTSIKATSSSSSGNGDVWEFVTDQGLPFFRNKITGEISWTPPPGVNYMAASAAATAAAAAVPAAVAAANAATTGAAPARPALRILSVKKPVKKEQLETAAPVAPPTAASPSAEAPAPTAPAMPAEAEGQRTVGSVVSVSVKSAIGEASAVAATAAPVHAAPTTATADTNGCSGVAAAAADVDASVAACGPVADATSAAVKGELPDFIPSTSSRNSDGSSAIPAGYVFKKGHRGLGFYRDRPLQQHHRHQQWPQRRGRYSGPLQHHRGHAQQQQQHSTQQIQQHTQRWQQPQQDMQHEQQQKQQQTAPLKRRREEADADAGSPAADAAAAIAAAAAEAAASAATLWGTGAAANEEEHSSSGDDSEAAAGARGMEGGLTGTPTKPLSRTPVISPDGCAQVSDGDSRGTDEESGGDNKSTGETEGGTEDAAAASEAEEETCAAALERRVVPACEGPVIGAWVEAKEDGWDAIARRQQQQEQLLLLQQQQEEEALEHGEQRHVNAGVEQLRRLRAQVKRRGVHHDFSWQKDEEAEYQSGSCDSSGGSSTSWKSIEIRRGQRPAGSRQQQETE
ncbi:ww domain U1 zinc finger domain-containing protein, putative [Eimeria brunetti]|uniref:Ww domain U1 zinc finger domain-containing protein, putative n=1 Tax=Eimeria brunetti TaxID=51314 RepID=U6LZ78_9EIME|nr:ww domain U1 zinc finger domain-containing protein, putative [Eimeria brunetti]